jgi:hypothetical protein
MYEVIVSEGRRIIAREKFTDEGLAWEFYEKYCDLYRCEFKNLGYLKSMRR